MNVRPISGARLRTEDVDALCEHPGFRPALDGYCAASLARYQAFSPIQRWMLGDTGRSALSGVASVLAAMGGLTPRALLNASPVTRGIVSRGRVRLYLQRALANGLLAPADQAAEVGLDTALTPDDRFRQATRTVLTIPLDALGALHPDMREVRPQLEDPAFAARLSINVGLLIDANRQLFDLGSPVHLFLKREGGTRLLEALILRQPAARTRLLESCALSRAALAQAGFCSRVHVNRLLADGEARGLLSLQGRTLQVAPALSDAAARYFAGMFVVTRAGVQATLSQTAAPASAPAFAAA